MFRNTDHWFLVAEIYVCRSPVSYRPNCYVDVKMITIIIRITSYPGLQGCWHSQEQMLSPCWGPCHQSCSRRHLFCRGKLSSGRSWWCLVEQVLLNASHVHWTTQMMKVQSFHLEMQVLQEMDNHVVCTRQLCVQMVRWENHSHRQVPPHSWCEERWD